MKILVWGTGIYAADFLDRYRFLPHADGFVSGKEPSDAFRSQYMQGKPWLSSSDLADLRFDILLIAVFDREYIREMLSACEKAGIPGEKIVVAADLESPSRTDRLNPAESFVFSLLMRPFLPFTAIRFTEEWRRYYYLHEAELPLKIQRLSGGLDAESVETVRLMIERKCRIMPLREHSEFFLNNVSALLTETERAFYAQSPGWEEKTRKEYALPTALPLDFSVFHFHSGLRFLPDAARDGLRGRAVIDGGAFWGDSALVFEKYHPSSIHSFDLMPSTITALERTVKDRGLFNVVPVNMGLGDEEGGEADFYYNPRYTMDGAASITGSRLTQNKEPIETRKIPITTIDAYARKNRLDVGLIKLDVEGVELRVIRGALETIRSFRPVLLISIYHTPEDLFEIKPLIESLDLNYHFMIRHLHPALDKEYMLIGYPA